MHSTDKPAGRDAESRRPASEKRPARGQKLRILVADDHLTERDYVKTVLGYAGYEVLEAADGEAALQQVRSQRPDLLISDILMPKLDGLELVRQMRSQPDIAGTRVIIWSATYRQSEAQTMAAALDVARFLKKPVEPDILLSTVEEILRAPPPAPVPQAVLAKLEEAHKSLVSNKLYKKTLELEEEIAARQQIEAVLRESQQRFAGLVESAMDAIISIDGEQRIVLFNAAAETLFGCRAADAIGTSVERFIPQRFRAAHQDHVRRFAASGAPSRAMGKLASLWGLRADGEEFPIEASISKVHVEGQQQLTVILRDITERRWAEETLKDSERRLALALEAGGSAVWEMEVVTGVVRGGEQLYAMLGYAPGDVTTLTDWIALIHDDDRHGVPEMVDDIIRGKRDKYHFEVRLWAKDGSWRWLLSQAVAAERDARGRAVRLVGTHTDITERKMAEAEIQRLNAELERRVQKRTAELQGANEALLHTNMELQHFAHATAHDLQTPLRAIAGFAQLLREEVDGRGDERVEGFSSLIIDNAKRLQTLIQELLAYIRLDAQGRPFEAVDLRDVLDEVLGSLAILVRESGAEVSCEHLPTVSVDRSQIAQVLQNLIENGIKYNRSKPPRVSIVCALQEDEWIFSVADNGIGIDPKHHERIFEIFRRLHSYDRVPGTGIGLALCRHIVEHHGGRIWVESRPEAGSTFYFTLPLRRNTSN